MYGKAVSTTSRTQQELHVEAASLFYYGSPLCVVRSEWLNSALSRIWN